MKNRIIALLMVMVLVVLSFASCNLFGGDSGDSGGRGDGGSGNSDYPWSKTTLKFQMSEHSQYQELPSSSRRYLAGDLSETKETAVKVDDLIAQRNADAYEATNVEVQYTYLSDIDKYAWGNNIDLIVGEVESRDPLRPDMYCNFVYDMVGVSLKGAFANLYSTSYDTEFSGIEHNYFSFTKDTNYKDTGKDYMYEYMRSLTLSKYKMYCLSSDYFTDMVRAFFVVPVNIGLLETLQADGAEGEYNYDRVETYDEENPELVKTNYTIEDFYALVTAGDWTYETLADFSEAISRDNGGESGFDIRDTIGFALGTDSGLPASGMLYTTSIEIIHREYDEDKGDYTYSYPNTTYVGGTQFEATGTYEELDNFCKALSKLMDAKGVITVGKETTGLHGFGTENTDLTAIRERFSTGNILFGGIICVGSLEYEEYKDMNADGKKGYGIVPVPLYKSGDKYLTQIHNLGKIGAISNTTENFAQCTAFLNYQSTHSNEILNEYYNYKLAYDVGTGVTGNVEMLTYIRENVRSSFDKAFEDALAKFYSDQGDTDADGEKWHQMIKMANFKLDTMATNYAEVVGKKAERLYKLENEVYPNLPSDY